MESHQSRAPVLYFHLIPEELYTQILIYLDNDDLITLNKIRNINYIVLFYKKYAEICTIFTNIRGIDLLFYKYIHEDFNKYIHDHAELWDNCSYGTIENFNSKIVPLEICADILTLFNILDINDLIKSYLFQFDIFGGNSTPDTIKAISEVGFTHNLKLSHRDFNTWMNGCGMPVFVVKQYKISLLRYYHIHFILFMNDCKVYSENLIKKFNELKYIRECESVKNIWNVWPEDKMSSIIRRKISRLKNMN